MKILLLTDEVWNDRIHGNNVLSNWFDGFPAEFAQIYCSPGLPRNNCCNQYFQITDKMMINSILSKKRAGQRITEMETASLKYESTDVGHIGFLRKNFGNLLRLLKNIVWVTGRYDTEELRTFIAEFSPDIIFTPRMATPKMLRLERIVNQFANCPMVAFTGDNEYSLKMFSFSPIAWVNKFWVRKALRRNANLYSLYYTLSDEQQAEYEKEFFFPVKVLRKCAEKPATEPCLTVNHPIRLVYAGKLYCNRWKTLAEIGNAIHIINANGQKIILDIYTKDVLDSKMKQSLDWKDSVVIHGAISPEEVLQKYKECDVALHIESFDMKYKYATRLSFSTKIIDCISGGCAVLVVAWDQHSGLTYLQREQAAICISNVKDILPTLTELCENEDQILVYKKNALACALRNHSKEKIQRYLEKDFNDIIVKNNRR